MTPRPRTAEPVSNEALPKVAALLGGSAAGLAVTATPDLSLIVDADGVIRGATGAADFAEEKIGGWLGRRLVDTVTVESRTKVDELLRDAGAGEITRWRQVNHPSPTGIDLPIRYTALRPEADGPILVLGRDMRTVAALQRRLADTQQTLERDYDRLRAAETRYRLLFQICGEAVLVVDATTRRVIEANPSAARLLGRAVRRLVGVDVVELFDPASLRTLEAQHGSLRATGQAADIRASLPQGRGEVTISASLFRGEGGTSAILRLIPEQGTAERAPQDPFGAPPTRALIEAMPEGFVITDSGHRVVWANAAFLELAQLHQRRLQRPGAEQVDEAIGLGDGNEAHGRHHAEGRMLPAHQGLEAFDLARAAGHDRLVVQQELAFAHGLEHRGFERDVVLRHAVLAHAVDDGAALARFLGAAHGGVGEASISSTKRENLAPKNDEEMLP